MKSNNSKAELTHSHYKKELMTQVDSYPIFSLSEIFTTPSEDFWFWEHSILPLHKKSYTILHRIEYGHYSVSLESMHNRLLQIMLDECFSARSLEYYFN